MCPKCLIPMLTLEWEGIEIDMCAECAGIWLDEGELELISERAGADHGRLSQALEEAKRGRTSPLECPRCDKKLHVVTVQGKKPIEIDECPSGPDCRAAHGPLPAAARTASLKKLFASGLSSPTMTSPERARSGCHFIRSSRPPPVECMASIMAMIAEV